jgi:hypothetical protein
MSLAAVAMLFTTVAQSEKKKSAFGDYIDCLAAKVQVGTYASRDGGKSALRLMAQCLSQWKVYTDKCLSDGRSTENDCDTKSARVARSMVGLNETGAK